MKGFLSKLFNSGICALAFIGVIWILSIFLSYGVVSETSDISDYGKIYGNFDNENPREFIFSFFPETIDSSFSDIQYHYVAKKGDTFAYECYLEFVIEDTNDFSAFIDNYTIPGQAKEFLYDNSFIECTISDVLHVDLGSPNENNGYSIDYAEMGKILYSPEEQRVIFTALGVYDGGGTYTNELNTFFNRFNIDVIDYQQNAYFGHLKDKGQGIVGQ